MGFWIIAGLLTLMIGASVAVVFLRPDRPAPAATDQDLQIYRDQLKEVERDLARGTLSEDEAERTRTEVARRLLEADKAMHAAQSAPVGQSRPAPALVILALLLAGSGALYWVLGAPGYPDLPIETRISLVEENRAGRPSQADAEAVVPQEIRVDPDERRAELLAQLRTEMERRPDEVEGLRLLAFEESRIGNFRAARLAQERLIEALGDDAEPDDLLNLAEMMFMAAGGYISPETEALLQDVLVQQPTNGGARYYVGLMFARQGRPDLGYSIWRNLLADSQPGDPWLPPIRGQIEAVAAMAGDPVSLEELPQPPERPELAGPSDEDLAAAQELSEEDRRAMIDGMVANLAERLAVEGGPPEDWARLISSYLVLGQERQARSIYDEALRAFAGSDEAMALIREAGAALEAEGADE